MRSELKVVDRQGPALVQRIHDTGRAVLSVENRGGGISVDVLQRPAFVFGKRLFVAGDNAVAASLGPERLDLEQHAAFKRPFIGWVVQLFCQLRIVAQIDDADGDGLTRVGRERDVAVRLRAQPLPIQGAEAVV